MCCQSKHTQSHNKWQSTTQSNLSTDFSHVQNGKGIPSQQFVNEINSDKKKKNYRKRQNYFPKSLWLATSSTDTNSRPSFQKSQYYLVLLETEGLSTSTKRTVLYSSQSAMFRILRIWIFLGRLLRTEMALILGWNRKPLMKLLTFTNLGESTPEEADKRKDLVKLDKQWIWGEKTVWGKSCGLSYWQVISLWLLNWRLKSLLS